MTLRVTDALLIVMVLLFAWSLYRAQRNKDFNFDLFDLIMENGRVSKLACVFMGAFAATTWVLIRLTVDGKMTEGYVASYGTMWVAPVIAKLFSAPAPPGTTTTVTATEITTGKP